MSFTSLYPFQDQYLKACPQRTIFVWNITAAKTSVLTVPQSATLGFYDAITQAQIDSFYGTASEVTAVKYDATAMGTDAFGVLLNFGGQVQTLVKARAYTASGTGNGTEVARSAINSGLTDSSLTTQGVLTSAGNVALRYILTGLDILTAGLIVVEVDWISK